MKFLVSILLLIMIYASIVGAEEGKSGQFSGFVKFEKYQANYEVNADGTHTETHEILMNVLTDEGISSANQTDISFSESMQELELLSAYTLKKDGRKIDAPPANIQERAAVAGGGPMYSDIKAKVIIFPDVAVGDKVGYSYKIIQKTALFPGQFSMIQVFTKFMVYDEVRISVSVPINSLKLQTFAFGLQGGALEDKDGRKRWSWKYKNEEIVAPEYGSVDPLDYGPRVIVSSFKDYGAMATAYEERARSKAVVTDKIRVLAEELTKGIVGQHEQAKALYNWVTQNIKYAGNYLGVGSVVPHDTDMILANRLGDCKDHATVLQALLAAKGIESTPVLINAGYSFKLPDIPSVWAFDHVINYIPSLDLYVDSTSEYTPFGLLPPSEYGKQVIHTANFTGIRQTPSTDYKTSRFSMKMNLKINEDGSADGETSNKETGIFSVGVRASMAYLQPNMEDQIVRGIIANSGYTGTGSLIKGNPREMSDSFAYGLKYHLENAMNLPGPGAIFVTPVLPTSAAIASVVQVLNMPERTLDYLCYGGISTEEFTIMLPKSAKILALPKDVHMKDDKASYDSTYTMKDNTVIASRKFVYKISKNLCTPKDDRDYRPFAREIRKDVNAQIVYQ